MQIRTWNATCLPTHRSASVASKNHRKLGNMMRLNFDCHRRKLQVQLIRTGVWRTFFWFCTCVVELTRIVRIVWLCDSSDSWEKCSASNNNLFACRPLTWRWQGKCPRSRRWWQRRGSESRSGRAPSWPRPRSRAPLYTSSVAGDSRTDLGTRDTSSVPVHRTEHERHVVSSRIFPGTRERSVAGTMAPSKQASGMDQQLWPKGDGSYRLEISLSKLMRGGLKQWDIWHSGAAFPTIWLRIKKR